MKRFNLFIFPLVLLFFVVPVLAQPNGDNLITLNDATPAIDVVITLPPDSTGAVSLDLALAMVTLKDANDAVVFTAADERLRGLELNIAPNSGTHVLTVERLPGAPLAYVSVVALPEISLRGSTTLVNDNRLTLNQETALQLSPNNPGGSVSIAIPDQTVGVISATFPRASVITQLVDDNGVLIAESSGGHVDGVTFVLDSGNYGFTVLGNNLAQDVIAGVRAVSSLEGGFAVLDVPAAPTQSIAQTTTGACYALVNVSSANLRSGPGTAYTVLGYAYRGENYPVGGLNREGSWAVVGMPDGKSAWLALSAAQIQGACATLTVFDTPTQNATQAQLLITASGRGYKDYDDDHDDHDDHDHDHKKDKKDKDDDD